MRISAYADHPHEPHGSATAWPSLINTDPLPNEDVVYHGSTTEHDPQADDDGGDDGWGLVEVQESEENNPWKDISSKIILKQEVYK